MGWRWHRGWGFNGDGEFHGRRLVCRCLPFGKNRGLRFLREKKGSGSLTYKPNIMEYHEYHGVSSVCDFFILFSTWQRLRSFHFSWFSHWHTAAPWILGWLQGLQGGLQQFLRWVIWWVAAGSAHQGRKEEPKPWFFMSESCRKLTETTRFWAVGNQTWTLPPYGMVLDIFRHKVLDTIHHNSMVFPCFFPGFFGKETVFPWKNSFPSLKRQLLNEGEVDQGRLPRGKGFPGRCDTWWLWRRFCGH